MFDLDTQLFFGNGTDPFPQGWNFRRGGVVVVVVVVVIHLIPFLAGGQQQWRQSRPNTCTQPSRGKERCESHDGITPHRGVG